jgi:TonB family protein
MKRKTLLLISLLSYFWCFGQKDTSGTGVSSEYSAELSEIVDKPTTFDIRAEVLDEKFVVYYTLKTESPSDIYLYASYDKGETWKGPMEMVTGDVGHTVSAGSNKIFWDCKNEKGFDLNSKGVVFKVEARFIQPKESVPFGYVAEMPAYPGGEIALYTFLSENISYPELEKINNIEGTVFVRFVVEKDGTTSNFSILKGVKDGEGLDREAIRACKKLGKFNPGKQNGVPVRVTLTIPINFTIEGGGESDSEPVLTKKERKEIEKDSEDLCATMFKIIKAKNEGDTKRLSKLRSQLEIKSGKIQSKYSRGGAKEKELERLVKPCKEAMKNILEK